MKQFWDERYAGETYIYGEQPNAFFKQELAERKAGRLLLPGEGEGRNAVWAAIQGWQVDAVDQSIAGKEKALRLAQRHGVQIHYTVADLSEYNFEAGQYDFIALIFVHFPPAVRTRIHQQLIKALRPGGCLLVEAFHKTQLQYESGGPKDAAMLYDADLLSKDFEALEVVRLEESTDMLHEGEWHKGKASVVRMLACLGHPSVP